MPASKSPSSKLSKGEQSRQHLLDVAAECFRKEGVHGSSISRISKAANMSPGHIYHFFPSKEAIVEAIAEREENEVGAIVRMIEAEATGKGGMVGKLLERTAEIVQRHRDPAYASLRVELAAEAGRNPDVMRIVSRTDNLVLEEMFRFFRSAHEASGFTDAQLKVRLELIALLFNGLSFYSLTHSDIQWDDMSDLVSQVIRFLLQDPADPS